VTLGKDISSKVIITNGCFGPHERLHPFFNALQLAPRLHSLVEEFTTIHFQNKKVIGVHIRYYDRNLRWTNHTNFWLDPEKALKICEEKITEAICCLSSTFYKTVSERNKITSTEKAEEQNDNQLSSSDYVIFLATNSAWVVDTIKCKFENVITYEKSFGSKGEKELHVEMPVETAQASAIEMFLLAKSDVMVRYPPESWFSYYASLYVKEIIV
jgi:hypothetical protein